MTTFSNNLEKKDRFETGLKLLRSFGSSERFFHKRFDCTFKYSWECTWDQVTGFRRHLFQKSRNSCLAHSTKLNMYFFRDLCSKLAASGVLFVMPRTLWWRQIGAREKSAQPGNQLVKQELVMVQNKQTHTQKHNYSIKSSQRHVQSQISFTVDHVRFTCSMHTRSL